LFLSTPKRREYSVMQFKVVAIIIAVSFLVMCALIFLFDLPHKLMLLVWLVYGIAGALTTLLTQGDIVYRFSSRGLSNFLWTLLLFILVICCGLITAIIALWMYDSFKSHRLSVLRGYDLH
jgi:chromate transport protein ChrA